jgi:nanoRNase/pAp phosphatase (c-di-AMP/oligoRNAs hydrolase)
MNPQDTQLDFPQAAPQQEASGTPQQLALDRLRTAVNVLVTVNNNPSVDQLAAAIGFTLLLNKMGKHATAVFSGDVPSTIEFLKPSETLEKNTDSLRDFIVSLDKAKADKLRYKVEENVVKIFITPYKTSLSEADLNFSQGDFNVDAIVALGITEREQLDQTIIAHGRILHDATVIAVTAGNQASNLGVINWQDSNAASLCEMLADIGDVLEPGLLDNQIATAYLTGIVAQTNRFKNENTTPKIMTLAAKLLAAGANQQLIAKSLEQTPEPKAVQAQAEPIIEEKQTSNGELSIDHTHKVVEVAQVEAVALPMADSIPMEIEAEEPEAPSHQIEIDEHGNLGTVTEKPQEAAESRHMLPLPQPAQTPNQEVFGGDPHMHLAHAEDDGINEPHNDPLTDIKAPDQIFNHNSITLPPMPVVADPVEEITIPQVSETDTLHNIEKTFASPHIAQDPTSTLDEIEESVASPHVVVSARDAVQDAIAAEPYNLDRPEPLQALNANPLVDPVQEETSDDPVLANLGLQGNDPSVRVIPSINNNSPPPVPPPLMPVR